MLPVTHCIFVAPDLHFPYPTAHQLSNVDTSCFPAHFTYRVLRHIPLQYFDVVSYSVLLPVDVEQPTASAESATDSYGDAEGKTHSSTIRYTGVLRAVDGGNIYTQGGLPITVQ